VEVPTTRAARRLLGGVRRDPPEPVALSHGRD